MSDTYEAARESLRRRPRRWLVTGAAGFIGSNLVEALLGLGQQVVGLDDLSTGHRANLADAPGWAARGGGAFSFRVGDIRDAETCSAAARGADVVLHQAALGSVPASLDDPARANASNVDGFLNVLLAARGAGARVVYASSSAVYGDDDADLKTEDRIGRALSPYAVTKHVDELYAGVFGRAYGLPAVGLRYFNIYGPRQDPEGAYAAVIPKWTAELLRGGTVTIHGDGSTRRDFCHVEDVVQANILAAVTDGAEGEVFNIGSGTTSDLNALHATLARLLAGTAGETAPEPRHGPFREGDIRFSAADIARARARLGFAPAIGLEDGLRRAMPYYRALFTGGGPARPESSCDAS